MGEGMIATSELAEPQCIEDTGVRKNLLEDLALKILYVEGESSLLDLANRMRLNLGIVEVLFQRLRKEEFCEVKGMTAGVHRIDTTSKGKARALELMMLNQYTGPAPVSLKDYSYQVRAQSVKDVNIHAREVERAFEHLVLEKEILTQVGAAVVSGQSIFLYGPTGTGKTAIAESLPRIYQDSVWIPYAVEVAGQIITVFESGVHELIEAQPGPGGDGRWVLCRRPRVITGGELTIDLLDLQFNPVTKFYSAPLQIKANNGVLIIDDFGRQRLRPEELLNRWIVPLDRRIDYFTLAGGTKFEVPFELLVVFSTNLDPRSLADEAFLRRIQTKVRINYVSPEQFHEIFRRLCDDFKLEYDSRVVDGLIETLSTELNQPLRACYPRDIIQQICWAARFEGKTPQLESKTVLRACRSYFLCRLDA